MVYNGQEQAPVIPETEFYKTVQNEKHLDAGEYNVTMELKNPALYRWPESEEKITILPYKIQKAKADITGTPDPEKLTLNLWADAFRWIDVRNRTGQSEKENSDCKRYDIRNQGEGRRDGNSRRMAVEA